MEIAEWLLTECKMPERQLTSFDNAWSFSLLQGVNRLGRNPDNNLHVAESSVSGFHCEIHVSERMILVKDLGSTNGTFIDGQPVQEALLQSGQVLRLGSLELRLEERAVQIAIPTINFERAPSSVTLPDGRPSCVNHSAAQATLHCTHCEQLFCEACVHFLQLTSGKPHLFCPSCSSPCEPIPGMKAKPKRRSLLAWLAQALQLRFHSTAARYRRGTAQ
jgi:hypothetical protein